MPTNPDHVHQCDFLAYRGARVELVSPGEEGLQHWRLRWADLCPVVFFCPFCGRDFRADTWLRTPGHPEGDALLVGVREAHRIGELMAAPRSDRSDRLDDDGPFLHPSPRRRAGRYDLLADDEVGDAS